MKICRKHVERAKADKGCPYCIRNTRGSKAQKIWDDHADGLSFRKTASKHGVSSKTVQRIWADPEKYEVDTR